MTRIKQQERLIEWLGIEEAFDAVIKAMSDYQMQEIYNYILRCYDIPEEAEDEEN